MRLMLIGALMLAASPGAAQEAWRFAVTPYVWVPGITNKVETRFGTAESKMSNSDALSDLNFAFMGAFEADRGRWGFVADLLYTDLSTKADTPFGRLFSEVKTDVKLTALEGYAFYRLYDQPKVSFDLGGGLRGFSIDTTTTLEGGTLETRSYNLDESWVDVLVAARGRVNFNDRWYANAAIDYGGFDGSNDSSWQALATVGYEIDDRWSVRGGWRYLDIKKEIDDLKLETELSGPIVGVSYRF